MKTKTLKDLFFDQLRDTFDAEKQMCKALPKLASAAYSPELRAAFDQHANETEVQIERLKQVAEACDYTLRRKTCDAMEGLVSEAKEMMDEKADPMAKDAGLIAAAQKAEHYEIASYGCLATWAEMLGHAEASRLLLETLEEEKRTDARLTELAERFINAEAVNV
ncbi:MAG: ferritin-like domain-containing protein [Gemmataceae bacterium]